MCCMSGGSLTTVVEKSDRNEQPSYYTGFQCFYVGLKAVTSISWFINCLKMTFGHLRRATCGGSNFNQSKGESQVVFPPCYQTYSCFFKHWSFSCHNHVLIIALSFIRERFVTIIVVLLTWGSNQTIFSMSHFRMWRKDIFYRFIWNTCRHFVFVHQILYIKAWTLFLKQWSWWISEEMTVKLMNVPLCVWICCSHPWQVFAHPTTETKSVSFASLTL